LAIEWDVIAVEMTLLAGIIYGAVYLEQWQFKRFQDKKDRVAINNIIKFISNDLERKLGFIEESIKDRDFKPFFTNMWDAVILTNKQGLVSFEIFENLQATYSWMKYYHAELEAMKHRQEKKDEKELIELLSDVRKSIEQSLKLLKVREN
jgi:hypothetical protein